MSNNEVHLTIAGYNSNFLQGSVMRTTNDEQILPDCSIASAAIEVSYFERALLFKGRGSIHLAPNLERHPAGQTFKPVNVTTAVRNYTLKDVILDSETLFIFVNGRRIRETNYFGPSDKDQRAINTPALVRLDDCEDVIIGYNNAHLGYQHWLTQCVPAIDWSLRQTRSRDVRLLLPILQRWQEDFLDLLGYSHIPRMTPELGCQYVLPSAEYSDFLTGVTSFEICRSVLETAARISERVPKAPSPRKVLYVPCSSPYYGSIGNEGEVLELLRRRGVYIVDDSELNTSKRINLFREAEVVIGPIGQGLSDILFCRSGTLLWEWMPAHHQNASFNRLAQTAELDYWADLFEGVGEALTPGQWNVDLSTVDRGLSDISNRLARRATVLNLPLRSTTSNPDQLISSTPINELMLAFESLGDNCEFGLIQRHGGAEPLGLLRFAGIYLPIEVRLERLVAALRQRFEGLGSAETLDFSLAGEPGKREFLVRESAYDLMYHTFILEGQSELDEIRRQESKRLQFLRRKLLEDLKAAEKIWVWKSSATSDPDQVYLLMHMLRSFGQNRLLWVVESDEAHLPGTIEQLDPDFVKGYIERFAPYDNAVDVRPISWFEVCQRTYNLFYSDRIAEESDATEEVADPSQHDLSDGDISKGGPAAAPATLPTQSKPKKGVSGRFWDWLRLRSS
jgi:hypothetical protein